MRHRTVTDCPHCNLPQSVRVEMPTLVFPAAQLHGLACPTQAGPMIELRLFLPVRDAPPPPPATPQGDQDA